MYNRYVVFPGDFRMGCYSETNDIPSLPLVLLLLLLLLLLLSLLLLLKA